MMELSERRDAKRYRLLRDYLLANGFVVHEQTTTGEAPFVKNSEFYGSTFEAAVDSLEQVDTSPRPPSRPKVYQMPKRDEAQAPKRSGTQNAASR